MCSSDLVVVHVEGAEQLRVPADRHVLDVVDPVYDALTSKLLHLDVVEFSEIAETLDELGCDAAVELERSGGDETIIQSCMFPPT